MNDINNLNNKSLDSRPALQNIYPAAVNNVQISKKKFNKKLIVLFLLLLMIGSAMITSYKNINFSREILAFNKGSSDSEIKKQLSLIQNNTVQKEQNSAAGHMQAIDHYAFMVAEQVAKVKQYPSTAVARKWQGETIMHVKFAPNATIQSATIAKSSGFEILDNEALQSLSRIPSLPTPPKSLTGSSFSVLVPVQFLLY
jgi:TonB family protein